MPVIFPEGARTIRPYPVGSGRRAVRIVTAAPEHVPQPLVDQLKPGGRLVVPVGPYGGTQQLLVVTRGDDGGIIREQVIPVRFVPLVRRP